MKKINILESPAFVLNYENIDTDQIIPAAFLKGTSRDGLGKSAFYNWRYNVDGSEKRDSIFAHRNSEAKILVAGKNFGCGSSREHAVWALLDYDFKVVISSYFADIFKNNSLNNGLLPIMVSDDFLANLMMDLEKQPNAKVEVSLEKQIITNPVSGEVANFEINAFKKEMMLNGFAPIDYLLSIQENIKAFEKETGR
jgi:3-isopropylmalate/(R)-2-methylmalate dehydratase small subunit